jgi:hypothetical protein
VRHEMLTQRNHFCRHKKKGTLSQHFVTHVVTYVCYAWTI